MGRMMGLNKAFGHKNNFKNNVFEKVLVKYHCAPMFSFNRCSFSSDKLPNIGRFPSLDCTISWLNGNQLHIIYFNPSVPEYLFQINCLILFYTYLAAYFSL
jgi:hypothetical protein